MLFLFFVVPVSAQDEYDSIRNVIEQYKSLPNVVIPNIHYLVMEKLEHNDIPGVKKIYHYVMNGSRLNPRDVFYDREHALLAYVLNDEHFLLQHLRQTNDTAAGKGECYTIRNRTFAYSYEVYSSSSNFSEFITRYARAHFDSIRNNLEVSGIYTPETAQVLGVYLRFLLMDNKQEAFSAASIEKDTRQTLGSHYNGKFSKLVNTRILENITPTPLHFSFEAGGGIVFRGNDIKQYMPVTAGIYALTGITYKKAVLELSFMENESKLHKTLPVKNELWWKDSSVVTHNAFATLGYTVLDNQRWCIYPFAGATMAWMQPSHDGPTQLKRTVINSGAGIVTGIAIQRKNKRWSYRYTTRKGSDFYSYCALRLSYTSRSFKEPALRSNSFNCTLSIMGIFGERVFFLPWSWFNGINRGVIRH